MTDLNRALEQLKTTVSSINERVEQGKAQANQYKQTIIEKLGEVIMQLREVQNNPKLKNIPNLQSQLNASNNALKQKTTELEETKTKLDKCNAANAQLNTQIGNIQTELNAKKEEMQKLMEVNGKLIQENKQHQEEFKKVQQQITSIQERINNLELEKQNIEKQLASKNQEINTLVEQIDAINNQLQINIGSIDTIAKSLDTDDGETSNKFKEIAQNISTIIEMINGEGSKPSSGSSFGSEPEPISRDRARRLEGEKKISRDDFDIKTEAHSIDALKRNTLGGGRKKTRTRKHKGRKTKKYKGGYVYTSSKELDKSSSIVSDSSSRRNKQKSRHTTDTQSFYAKKYKNINTKRNTKRGLR